MQFCSPRCLNLEIISRDILNNASQYDESEHNVYIPSNKILLPKISYILQNPQGLEFSTKQEKGRQLFNIEIDEVDQKQIIIRKQTQQQNYLYKILKEQYNQQLIKNDVIKIGQFQLLVKQISLSPFFISSATSVTYSGSKTIIQEAKVPTPQNQDQTSVYCRICWQKQVSKSDPLISLCKCSGSIQLTHFSCMKQWYKKFIFKQQSQYSEYYICRQGICDLCHESLHWQFIHKNTPFNLVEISPPKQPHIIFQLKNIRNELQLILVKFEKDVQVKIGSSQDSDLCFDDDMVDQDHAELKMIGNKIYIVDQGSKSGTLIKLRQNNKFNSNEGIRIQCQNLILNFQSQKNIFNWFCPIDHYTLRVQDNKNDDKSIIFR